MIRATAIALLLALGACTYTEVDLANQSLVSWRLMTQTAASIETPEMRAGYSSDPQAEAMGDLQRLLVELAIGRPLRASEGPGGE